MFDAVGFVLTLFNILLLGWFITASIVWISEHEGGISCYIIPPVFLFISLCSCLFSVWVHFNF